MHADREEIYSRGGVQLQFQQLLFGVGGAAAVWNAMYYCFKHSWVCCLTCKREKHPEWQQSNVV